MIKLWSMFPPPPSGPDKPKPREYRSLSITGAPGLPRAPLPQIGDGTVYLAENYAFIQDNDRQRTYVLGLQTVQLDFEHLGSTAQEIATAIAALVEAELAPS